MGAINFIAALEAELARLQGNALRTDIPADGIIYRKQCGPQCLWQNCFITVSSPHRVSHLQQYSRIIMVIHCYNLEVLSASFATRDNTVVYTIVCQVLSKHFCSAKEARKYSTTENNEHVLF